MEYGIIPHVVDTAFAVLVAEELFVSGCKLLISVTSAGQIIPVGLGLLIASIMHRVATGRLGAIARTVLFLPQVIPLVAAGIIWGWLLALLGLINQILRVVGLGEVTRVWLGDFDTALPLVIFVISRTEQETVTARLENRTDSV